MQKKIFSYYLILIIIGVTITGFFISQLSQRIYKNEVQNTLKNTAYIIKYYITDQTKRNILIEYNKIANDLSKEVKSRITFIDFKGNVLGESETNINKMKNHLDRKEVKEAILGEIGEDIRSSKTLNVEYLYISVPLKELNIMVRTSMPLKQIENIDITIWDYTIIGILAGILFTALLSYKFSRSIIRPLKELIIATKEISLGNYTKRVNSK